MDLSRREQGTNNARVDGSSHTSILTPEAIASSSVGTHKTRRRGNGGVSAVSNGLRWSGKRSLVQTSPSGMAEAMLSFPHKPLIADSSTTSFSYSITGFVPTTSSTKISRSRKKVHKYDE